MRTKMDETLKAVQARYRMYFHKSVRTLLMNFPSDYVYAGGPPTAKPASEWMADESQLNLLSKTVGPFQIIGVTLHTAIIDGNSIYMSSQLTERRQLHNRSAHPQSNSRHLTYKATTLLRPSSQYRTHDVTHVHPSRQEIRCPKRQDTYQHHRTLHTTQVCILSIIMSTTSTRKRASDL